MKLLSFNSDSKEKTSKVCPSCGSVGISRKARAHRESKRSKSYQPGQEGLLRGYYCRQCGAVFSTPAVATLRPRQIQKNPRIPAGLKVVWGV